MVPWPSSLPIWPSSSLKPRQNKDKSEGSLLALDQVPGTYETGPRYHRSRQPGTPRQAGERGRNPAPERQEGGTPRTEMRGHRSRHSEISANLLYPLRSNRRDFSECALMDDANQVDFDSAIRRFESSRPSQQIEPRSS
jgi:hypothetical protein